MPFTQLGLNPDLRRALVASEYERPTPIQSAAVPVILEGRDVAGTAQTGTGKTAAFVLPILQRLGSPAGKIRALILTPTRELAVQVESAIRKYGRFVKLRSVAIYGGISQRPQEEALRRGVDIVVATPGRLLDLFTQGLVNLSNLEILTLDEADRMLDMGFLPDIREVVRHLPRERQTLLFTATLPQEIQDLTRSIQTDPALIQIEGNRTPVSGVEQRLYPVMPHLKNDLLLHLLERETMQPLLVFTKTKHGADRLHGILERRRFKAALIHSGRTQSQRQAALDGFRRSEYQILIATDIVARGIDVQNISHVINFDLPNNPDDYIHRIGRTARAESTGMAYSFIAPEDEAVVRSIEKAIRRKLSRVHLDDFVYNALPKSDHASSPAYQRSREPVARQVTASGNSSEKVFDRTGLRLGGRTVSGSHSSSRTEFRDARAGNRSRVDATQGRRNADASGWVEGTIGLETEQERLELRQLQRRIFGSSSPQRKRRDRISASASFRPRY